MNRKGCRQRKISVAYPKHAFRPEDLLHFIEATEFSEKWDALGLGEEEDATSLQLCIMASPAGYEEIKGTDGVRRHIHSFSEWGINKPDIAAYYAYFEDYGIVYFICIDDHADKLTFSNEQIDSFRSVVGRVREELDRRRTIR